MTCELILARQVCRTGLQTIVVRGGRYFVTIVNRTYSSEHEIPPGRLGLWLREFGVTAPPLL